MIKKNDNRRTFLKKLSKLSLLTFAAQYATNLKSKTTGKVVVVGGKFVVPGLWVVVGDKVVVALSPYDLTRGRITYRHRSSPQLKRQV